MHDWTTLTTHLGDDTSSPSNEQLKNALSELFKSNDDEHPNSWIECGSEDSFLYSLDIYSSGFALYTKYSDVDMSDELEYKRIDNVNEEIAFNLWQHLIAGNFEKIK